MDYDQQLWDASKVIFKDFSLGGGETLFFLCADGNAQLLITNFKNWKAEAAQGSGCWAWSRNEPECLPKLDLESSIDGCSETLLPIAAIYGHMGAYRRGPNYGLRVVPYVTICGRSGMKAAVATAGAKNVLIVVHSILRKSWILPVFKTKP